MELENITENEMLDQAIDALRQTAGLDIAVTKLKAHGFKNRADAFIRVTINHKNYAYVVAVKNVDRFATVAQVKHQLEEFTEKPLLIAPRLTDTATDKCIELGLNFIDLAGNGYINEPELFILVRGQKQDLNQQNKPTTNNVKKAGTATYLRMVFTLLCKPEMLNAPYREIEKVAGIALGTIGLVFNDLEARGFTLGGIQKANRKLIQTEKLIQEWVTNYPIKLRPKLNKQKFRAPNQDWWERINVKEYKAQWGAEVAADKLTKYLKPKIFTLYLQGKDIRKNMTKLIVENRLIPDQKGDIEILEAFWNFDEDQFLAETVPPLLIYADLVASNDPRNLETAKMIYNKYINHADN